MSDYGVFESINGSEGERKIASRDTQRKLDAAIDDVKRQYGAFLFASRDGEEWNDRVALCKNDMLKTIDAHIVPVTGVVRRIVKACKDEWRFRAADKTGPAMDNDVTFAPKKKDKELKYEPGFDAYLNKVDQNSDAVEENCFKESRYFYADATSYGDIDEEIRRQTGDAAPSFSPPGLFTTEDSENPTLGSRRDGDGNVIPDSASGFDPDGYPVTQQTVDSVGGGDGALGFGTAAPPAPAAAAPAAPSPAAPSAAAPAAAAAATTEQSGTVGGDGSTGGTGGGDAPASSPMTSGDVADGGRAGAENGNNAGITGADYVVQQGDTLTDIAQRGYGDMNKYDDLASANGITNPDVLTPGQTINALDGADFSGNNNIPGNLTNPAGGGSDGNMSTPNTGPAAPPEVGVSGVSTSNGLAGGAPAFTTASLALNQYIDWCDSFGFRRASVKNLDKYAENLNDQAYFEIASALTDPSSPIYRTAAPGAVGGNGDAPQGMGTPAPQTTTDADGLIVNNPVNIAPQAIQPMDLGAGAGAGFGGGGPGAFDLPGFGRAGRRRHAGGDFVHMDGMGGPGKSKGEYEGGTPIDTDMLKALMAQSQNIVTGARMRTAAPDYLQKADEALTNLLNQKAEEFQETIAPLQQALQTVQQAEAAQQAANPLGVQPPAGTVNVLPGQGDPAAGGGMPPGGGDPSMGGGMDPSMMGGGDPSGGMGGDPAAMMGGAPPMDPSQMQMQARRKRVNRGKAQGANAPRRRAGIVNDVDEWGKGRGVTTGNPEVDLAQFESETGTTIGPKQRNKLTKPKPTSTANPMPKSKQPISTKHASFFTRKVAGWEWDDHLNGYLASKNTPFTCKCGSKHPVPSYSTCKCGKIYNSYVIGTGGDNHQASVEKFICREIPVRDNVIVANRKTAKDGGCTCWDGYERVPGTKPCADGSCRKKSAEKVKRHKLTDPGPLGGGKDDKMPSISEELGEDWYKRGPGGKYAKGNRRSR